MARKKELEKALLFQRVLAFLLDVFLVTLLVSTISSFFVDTERSNELTKEATTLMEEYRSNNISFNNFVSEYSIISYKMARNTGVVSFLTIIFNILYFVVFQIYNNGQTLGKKLMRIRIISKNDQLTMNQMIFRAFIANSILLELISFIFMMFSSKYVYFYGVGVFEFIQYMIIIASVFMIGFRKDGCAVHDLLARTQVVKE